jgi:hypothetical protein
MTETERLEDEIATREWMHRVEMADNIRRSLRTSIEGQEIDRLKIRLAKLKGDHELAWQLTAELHDSLKVHKTITEIGEQLRKEHPEALGRPAN